MIKLGFAARYLRQRLGLSQRAAATQLGISHVHLSNIENGRTSPTAATIEKYYEAWGIDLYMVAVAKYSDETRVPPALRDAVDQLLQLWNGEVEAHIELHEQQDVAECSASKN